MPVQLTKASYKNHIGVDHFYVGFSKSEISDLKKLCRLPFCVFTKVKSGRDSWQGVYWSTTQRSYFEMIESPKPGHWQFGLAVSANYIQYFDIRRIKALWKSRKKKPKSFMRTILGKRWFEGFFIPGADSPSVFMWAMHYFFIERKRKMDKRNQPSVIERFTLLELAVNPVFIKDLKETCYWVPMRKRKRGSVLEIEFTHKDRSPFLVRCFVDPKVTYTTFISLRAQASPFQVPLPKMKNFQIVRKSSQIILSRKNVPMAH